MVSQHRELKTGLNTLVQLILALFFSSPGATPCGITSAPLSKWSVREWGLHLIAGCNSVIQYLFQKVLLWIFLYVNSYTYIQIYTHISKYFLPGKKCLMILWKSPLDNYFHLCSTITKILGWFLAEHSETWAVQTRVKSKPKLFPSLCVFGMKGKDLQLEFWNLTFKSI